MILALSHNAVRFHGALEPVAAAHRELAESCVVPIGLHLDHVEDLALVEAATRLGFGSVMFDAAHLPYAENELVRRLRDAAAVLSGLVKINIGTAQYRLYPRCCRRAAQRRVARPPHSDSEEFKWLKSPRPRSSRHVTCCAGVIPAASTARGSRCC